MEEFRRQRAAELIWHPRLPTDREKGVQMLFEAYRDGDRGAGYDLAVLGLPIPERYQLGREERATLIAEQALAGDPLAALELAHTYRHDVSEEVLLAALGIASAAGSTEAGELLEHFRRPPNNRRS